MASTSKPPAVLTLPEGITNPYECLELANGATDDDVKKAWRALSRMYHPDKQVKASETEKQRAEVMFLRVRKAHDFLSDPVQKGLYDEAEERKASAAKRKIEREGAMGARRNAMRQKLEEEEARARGTHGNGSAGKPSAPREGAPSMSAREQRAREEEVRRENRVRREAHATRTAERGADAKAAAEAVREERANTDLRTISVKWKRKVHAYSEEDLAGLFRPHGFVEAIAMVGTKGNSATVRFETPASASTAAAAYSASETMRVDVVGAKDKFSWAAPAAAARPTGPGLSSASDHESLESFNARRAGERERLIRRMNGEESDEDTAATAIDGGEMFLRPPVSRGALAAMEQEVFAFLLADCR